MTDVSSIAAAVRELSATFAGRLLQPTDAGYDEARRVHNGLIDKRPALIAQCRGTADIVDAVRLARTLKLEVAVRGGGHNVAGRATIDGGLMIDLSPMKGIHVDANARTARAQGGVTWAELNRETQLHGLAVTGGVVSTTGIAGLTLGADRAPGPRAGLGGRKLAWRDDHAAAGRRASRPLPRTDRARAAAVLVALG
ncbi:MAG: FAD-binding oxidoreductase [Candidatus Binatia bacterium]